MGALEDAVDSAADLVGPLLNRTNREKTLEQDELLTNKPELVEKALASLQAINEADKAQDPNSPYDASLVGVVYGLIDLITFQGILPSLSIGVSFSQRPQPVIIPAACIPSARNEDLLSKCISVYLAIFEQDGTGTEPLISQRSLPDLIAGLSELSFAPQTSSHNHLKFQPQYERVLDITPTSRILPLLTSYLQQSVPNWLRPKLSKPLTLAPLRPHGIRHTIEFVSISYLSKNSPAPQQDAKLQSQIPIPLEAITQSSRLIAAVPNEMSSEEWFTRLAPQLWDLLDGGEGPELAKASGQIIASGILGRKSTGSPGAIGWKLFAEPLLHALSPQFNVRNNQSQQSPTWQSSMSDQVIVPEKRLFLSLKRLATIVTSYSHPGIIKRLVSPALLPLWGLLGHVQFSSADGSKKSTLLSQQWTSLPTTVLSRYMQFCCDPKQVDTIATNLFWDGVESWTYGPGSEGGVEIRQRQKSETNHHSDGDIFQNMKRADARIQVLVTLLSEADIDDDTAGAIILEVLKRCSSDRVSPKKALIDDDIDPFSLMVNMQLAEALVRKFENKLARSQHFIEFLSQLIQSFVDNQQSKSKVTPTSKRATRADLGRILYPTTHVQQNQVEESVSEDLVSFALSILSIIIQSPDFKNTTDHQKAISGLLPSLRHLSQNQSLPLIITNAASNLIPIVAPGAVNSDAAERNDTEATLHASLKEVMSELTSQEPPNRTWAISTLGSILKDPQSIPLIDFPATTHLLLSAAIAEPESYVYTAAIPVLADLAAIAPNPILRILTDTFVDVNELALGRFKQRGKDKDVALGEALDFRLRVGEVLNTFVTENRFWDDKSATGSYFNALKMLTEALLLLASRRGQRIKTQSSRIEFAEQERLKKDEGEKAWGGPIPNLLAGEEEETPFQLQERQELAKIVEGWESTSVEEDPRIRTSSLSIFSSLLEHRLQHLQQPTVDAALQIALNTLVLETRTDKAIVRRAAVLVIMGLLKGINALLEDNSESGVGLQLKQFGEVERVVSWVRDEDTDALVKGHAENVLEGIDTVRMKKWFGVRDGVRKLGNDLEMNLEENLQGLNVKPIRQQASGKEALIVEEIE